MNHKALRKPLNMPFTSKMLNMKKEDLQSVVDTTCHHLSLPDQNKLLGVIKKYEDLFDGTPGDWAIEPVSFEIKEGAKQYHGRAYPVPQAHKETLKKE